MATPKRAKDSKDNSKDAQTIANAPPVGLGDVFRPRPVSVYGPDADFIKFLSSDGFEFCLKKDLAMQSGTIRSMLSGPAQFSRNEVNCIVFNNIPACVLAKICLYMGYKARYTNSAKTIPEFPVKPDIALQLLVAAKFFDM